MKHIKILLTTLLVARFGDFRRTAELGSTYCSRSRSHNRRHSPCSRSYTERVFYLTANSIFIESECCQGKIGVIKSKSQYFISFPFKAGPDFKFQVGTELERYWTSVILMRLRWYLTVIWRWYPLKSVCDSGVALGSLAQTSITAESTVIHFVASGHPVIYRARHVSQIYSTDLHLSLQVRFQDKTRSRVKKFVVSRSYIARAFYLTTVFPESATTGSLTRHFCIL